MKPKEKPVCKLVGEDGNIFSIMGRARRALRDVGMIKEAKEMTERITKSGSYDAALQIVMEYVEAE